MRNRSQEVRNNPTTLCAVCGGRFGLIRHYVCRTALCSGKCVDRFKIRRQNDRKWLLTCQAA